MQDAITLFAGIAGIAGLDGASRPHRLALANGQALLVERWCGHEQLSDGFQWWVDVLANDAQLDVDAWLGIAATLSSRQTGGQDVLRSGVVCEAACVASDGGLARYRLCLVPWTWLLGQARQSRVFQERAVLDILQALARLDVKSPTEQT